MDKIALIVVDLQRDFCRDGALAVEDAEQIVPTVNALVTRFASEGRPVYATRDWHPPDHCSFRVRGGVWPAHCVAGTDGARFHAELELPPEAVVVSKATRTDREAYSGFEGTDLAETLRDRGIEEVWICGLATEYCVLATTLGALDAGFRVLVIEDAVRAVERESGDGALQQMQRAGARIISTDRL